MNNVNTNNMIEEKIFSTHSTTEDMGVAWVGRQQLPSANDQAAHLQA